MNTKHAMFVALALGLLCGPAAAVSLNPRGLGQVLIYPYYTVNKGQDTLLSVINTGDVGKVAHVRFHEGYNGRVALDFLVFLSPHDVWKAVVTAADGDAGSAAVLRTPDHSCTLPAIAAGGQPFVAADYAGGAGAAHPADGGPTTLDRTREGHVEIIAVGDIVTDSATWRRIVHDRADAPDAAKPHACGELTASNFDADLVTPTATLTGAIGIVDVAGGTYYPLNADALVDFSQRPLTNELAVVDADGLDRANSGRTDGHVEATVLVQGRPMTLVYARPIDAVSAVFMADAINNEVLLNPTLGAQTDWIVTFPTKRYYVDPALEPAAPRAPFASRFATPGEATQSIAYRIFDTEEYDMTDTCWLGCGIPAALEPLAALHEVNAIAFRAQQDDTPVAPSGVFGSRLAAKLAPYAAGLDSGWARLDFVTDQEALAGGELEGVGEVALNGLPVTGFMAYNIINANAQPGKLANYSGAFPHRSTATCFFPNVAGPPAACP